MVVVEFTGTPGKMTLVGLAVTIAPSACSVTVTVFGVSPAMSVVIVIVSP